jgi:hypothetical protein
MSHRIEWEGNLKGALGELFTKWWFEKRGIPISSTTMPNIDVSSGEFKEFLAKRQDKDIGFARMGFQESKIRETYGSQYVPDFSIGGTRILVEVKTGKSARLENNQRQSFRKAIELGWTVIIAKPSILIEPERIVLDKIEFFEIIPTEKKLSLANISEEALVQKLARI